MQKVQPVYTIIEISLDNAEENLKSFGELKVIKEYDDWKKIWELSVYEDKENELLEYLKNNLKPDLFSGAKSFYADSHGTTNKLVFNGKVFDSVKDKEEIISYGKSIGIPKEQLDWD